MNKITDVALRKAIEAVKKKWDDDSAIITFDDDDIKLHPSISTGALTLDLALGIGGLPKGRMSLILGNSGTGKTTLCLSVCKQAQLLLPEKYVYFIDTEHELDLFYADSMGLDIDRILLTQPESAEEALDAAVTIMRSGAISVMILDSIAALKTKEDIEKSSDENASMAGVARLMARELPRLKQAANKTDTVVLMTNQWRTGFAAGYSYKTNPGGITQQYYASVIIDLDSKTIKADETSPASKQVTAKINKNKNAAPYKMAKFDIEFGKGIVEESCIFEAGVTAGVIQKSGAWYNFKDEKWHGRENAIFFLKSNPQIKEEVKEAIKDSREKVINKFDPSTGEIFDDSTEDELDVIDNVLL